MNTNIRAQLQRQETALAQDPHWYLSGSLERKIGTRVAAMGCTAAAMAL
jgi:hypothetical protein